MARINIEDQFWDEVNSLIEKVGDRDRAIGNLLRFMKFAQARYKEGRIVTDADFKEQNFLEEIKGSFARPVDGGGWMVAGAQKHFAWLRGRVDAGRKGGKSKSEKKIDAVKANLPIKTAPIEIIDESSKANPKQTQSKSKASYSPSSSSSLSDSHSRSEEKSTEGVAPQPAPAPRKKSRPADKSLGARIFDSYASAYEERYREPPVRNATVNAQCAQIGSRLGEAGVQVAPFYVWHNKSFYVQNCHPIRFLLSDAESLHTQWKTGKQVTQQDGRNTERKQEVVNAFAHLLKPEGRKP